LIGYSVSEISTNDLQYFYNNIKRFLMFEAQKEKIGNVTHFVMRKINQVVKRKLEFLILKIIGSYKSRKEKYFKNN